jgi:hypothetical protein
MSRLTALLFMDLFGSASQARLAGRSYYDLNDLNYRRLLALAQANPQLTVLLEHSLLIERQDETICLVPVDQVHQIQAELDTQPPEERTDAAD